MQPEHTKLHDAKTHHTMDMHWGANHRNLRPACISNFGIPAKSFMHACCSYSGLGSRVLAGIQEGHITVTCVPFMLLSPDTQTTIHEALPAAAVPAAGAEVVEKVHDEHARPAILGDEVAVRSSLVAPAAWAPLGTPAESQCRRCPQ